VRARADDRHAAGDRIGIMEYSRVTEVARIDHKGYAVDGTLPSVVA
jgi:hypothetical protein